MSDVEIEYADELDYEDDEDYSDIEVEVLDEEGVQTMINNALALAGCSRDDLAAQARSGCFTNETARMAWFLVSSFV